MKKHDYIADLDAQTLSVENLIYVKHKMLRGNIVMLAISYALLLITLIGIPRIMIFARIFKDISEIVQIIGLSVYFISLSLMVMYYSYIIIYIIRYRKYEWVYGVHRFKKKHDLLAFTVRCLSIFLFILIFIFNPCTVDGSSMDDSFASGDKVVCTDVFYYPRKNDVVVFNALDYTGMDKLFIKRVVATEGDIITYDYSNGTFYVNGEKEKIQRVDDRNFRGIVDGIAALGGTATDDYGVVPNGYIVVLGDNRENSNDSGDFGPIKVVDIYGKVFIRVYPFNKIRWF